MSSDSHIGIGNKTLACIEHRGKMRVFVRPPDLPIHNMFIDRCWFMMENWDDEEDSGDAKRIRADAWIFGKSCYAPGFRV